ncbi:hypothetical protein F9802_03925 [Bacillus aerolatus]|uniref:Lipoprotein n=1 Tax=Bacillus aerolatus TaxID=2653354 RepID=A0A6I1FHL6_9BACI|nr:hypothetical protein [Bacillus aerolatus]KAB7707870.1 hypothetical protein F9802_03925 [Bacillus aerolatus]
MNKKLWVMSILAVLLLLAACGKAENMSKESSSDDKEAVETTANEEKTASLKLLKNEAAGEYLADSKGMTLYYFKKDESEKSNCQGDCLEKWPPYTEKQFDVPEGFAKEDFGTITREDTGEEQVTYKGFPLYYFANDKKEGDVTGQGVKEVWYIVNSDTTFQ